VLGQLELVLLPDQVDLFAKSRVTDVDWWAGALWGRGVGGLGVGEVVGSGASTQMGVAH
jgi:hypothetical protein